MMLSDIEMGPLLLTRARRAIEHHLGVGSAPLPEHPDLEHPGATFVTLTHDGELRGCIGSVQARRPIGDDVASNAVAAATHDLRFAPVLAKELGDIRIEVSLLSKPRMLAFDDEEDLLRKLRPGVDGVLLSAGGRGATFLPQVWEQLPEPQLFIAALKRKAGVEAEYPTEDLTIATYTVTKWKEGKDPARKTS